MKPPSPELEQLTQRMKEHEQRRTEAWEAGLKAAESVPHKDTEYRSQFCAGVLHGLARKEPDHNCSQLMFEWAFGRFWAKQIEDVLPDFEGACKWLKKQVEPISWGDADYSIWAEPTEEDHSAIVMEVHCAARDDNTYLFLHWKNSFNTELHIRTCWPRLKRVRGLRGTGWAYVEHPSLALYRREGMKPQYGDARDEGYALSYKAMLGPGRVDYAYSLGGRVYWAFWHLQSLISIVQEAGEEKVKTVRQSSMGKDTNPEQQ